MFQMYKKMSTTYLKPPATVGDVSRIQTQGTQKMGHDLYELSMFGYQMFSHFHVGVSVFLKNRMPFFTTGFPMKSDQ